MPQVNRYSFSAYFIQPVSQLVNRSLTYSVQSNQDYCKVHWSVNNSRRIAGKVFSRCWNELMDDAETKSSDGAFQIPAAATGKARLPIVWGWYYTTWLVSGWRWTATHHLNLSNSGWQNESFVVAVHHHDNANRACGDAPRVLIRIAHLPCFWVLERDVEHLREVLAEVMRSCSLETMNRKHVTLKLRSNKCHRQCQCAIVFI